MFGNNGREFGISRPKQPKCEVNRCRLHFLKMDCRCHSSFLLFRRLLVLPERTFASFRSQVACLFYPLEFKTLTLLPVTMPTTSKETNQQKLIDQGRRFKGKCEPPPADQCFVYAEKFASFAPNDKNNNYRRPTMKFSLL